MICLFVYLFIYSFINLFLNNSHDELTGVKRHNLIGRVHRQISYMTGREYRRE